MKNRATKAEGGILGVEKVDFVQGFATLSDEDAFDREVQNMVKGVTERGLQRASTDKSD